MEVLMAYIRENAPLSPYDPAEAHYTILQPSADIQAILDVLGRRDEDLVPKESRIEIGLFRTRLERANLYQASLKGANLHQANLKGASLYQANLEGANLHQANLYQANLYKANLEEADLEEANLEGAFLKEANFWGADLQRANLRGADLEGANLDHTTGLNRRQLEQAFGDETTTLPEGFESPQSWSRPYYPNVEEEEGE